ncbi:MAG: YjgN family protein [Bacteroidota bacterium]
MNPNLPHAPFAHHGDTGTMVRLSLVNLALNAITLSLWRFWGKTRVRRALWSGTTAWGDPAEYTGTGRELFLGFIAIVFAVFLPLTIALTAAQAAMTAGHMWAGLVVMLLQVLIAVLAAAGMYRARRYQLTRTVWRGIRAGQGGKAMTYGLIFLGVTVAASMSLGWAAPWAEMELTCYRLNHTTFGDSRFRCDARPGPLYKRFAVLWFSGLIFLVGIAVLIGVVVPTVKTMENPVPSVIGVVLAGLAWAVLTVALPMAWYRAGVLRHVAANTTFNGIPFALNAPTDALIKLGIGNWLISMLSLGILRPWAALRTFRFACGALRMGSEPDWSHVHQSQAVILRTGEGLAAVFDGAGDF